MGLARPRDYRTTRRRNVASELGVWSLVLLWSLFFVGRTRRGDEFGISSFHGRNRLWSVFPSQPEEIESKERHEPAVAVLLIITPLRTEMPKTDEPQGAKGEGQRDRRKPGPAADGRRFDLGRRSE